MFRRSGISWRRCGNGRLPQQGMLHADDGDCAEDVPSGDHRGCLGCRARDTYHVLPKMTVQLRPAAML